MSRTISRLRHLLAEGWDLEEALRIVWAEEREAPCELYDWETDQG